MIRIECDTNIKGHKCGKLLFKVEHGILQIKCRNSKCKSIKHIDLKKLLELDKPKDKTNKPTSEKQNQGEHA